jgi:hypothetical protein
MNARTSLRNAISSFEKFRSMMCQAHAREHARADYRHTQFGFNSERAARLDQLRVRDWLAAAAPFCGRRPWRFRRFALHAIGPGDHSRRRRRRLIKPLLGLSAACGGLAIDLVLSR